MPNVEKILGQVAPIAATETVLYTVPAATSAVGTSLVICNRSATPTTVRISVSAGGGATANKDYQFYDVEIGANSEPPMRLPNLRWTLAATDVVRVYNTLATISFSLYGSERT